MVLSCFLPASAFAGTVTDGTITESSEIIGTLEPIRGAEITSMREKNSKTYEGLISVLYMPKMSITKMQTALCRKLTTQ